MYSLKLKSQRKLYANLCYLIRITQKPIWTDRSNGYLTIFLDYEGEYALPDKKESSFSGVRQILDIARIHNIKTTFCIVGKLFIDYPEIIKRILQEGHDIASHTFNHCIVWKLNQREIQEDIRSTLQVYRRFGLTLDGMRCPQDKWNFRQLKIMCENGLNWSAESDKARFPYTVYRKDKRSIVRFPISVMDYHYRYYYPEQILMHLTSKVNHIQNKKIYGAIGFHPWLIGENDSWLTVISDFFSYIKKLNGLQLVTFNDAYKMINHS